MGGLAIVDYGVGNLFSLRASLAHLGYDAAVTRDVRALEEADGILLPGVGAFGDAAQKLRDAGLFEPLRALGRAGKPLFGICLGMQLLFERSSEFGTHEGLCLIPGAVEPLERDLPPGLKVPAIGWNALHLVRPDDPLLAGCREGDAVYFVHSYYATGCADSLVATAEYGVTVPALVRCGSVAGAQFHPEKSGDVGLAMLRAFAEEAAGAR